MDTKENDIVCNDDYGTHKCEQWYRVVFINPLDVKHNQYDSCGNNIQHCVNVLGLPSVKPVHQDYNLCNFITGT